MKTNFSENIKALRKEKRITQEQLADAMGVSAGAIYKWEQGISTPDIELIMEIAAFFGVSVDALIGYEMCKSDRERILEELKRIKHTKAYENCWDEVESWLRRYPNDFEIVYRCGIIYHLAGIETSNRKHFFHSVELLNHACALISQNNDPAISETEIHRDIAIAYLIIGEWEKGMEQLKKNNPCGVNDDIIGQELATNHDRRQEAVPYLTGALLHCTASLYRIVIGFVNLFFAQKDYRSAAEILRWLITYFDGLKTDRGMSYLDKNSAFMLALCGAAYEKNGETEKAKEYLKKARKTAMDFDAAPNYTSQNIRYCGSAELMTAYDNIGSTAMDTVVKVLREGADSPDDSILKLWKEICREA